MTLAELNQRKGFNILIYKLFGYPSLFYSHEPVATPALSSTLCTFFFEGDSFRRKKFPLELAEGCLGLRPSSQTSLRHVSHCKSRRHTQEHNQEGCVWARNKPFSLFRVCTDGMDFGQILSHPDTSSDDCMWLCLHMWKCNQFILWRDCWFLLFHSTLCFSNEGRLRTDTSCRWRLVPTSNVAVCPPSSCANTAQQHIK